METEKSLLVKKEWNEIQQKEYENKAVKTKQEFDEKVPENSNIETDESAILKLRAYFYGKMSGVFKTRIYDIERFVGHLEMPNEIEKNVNKFTDKATLDVQHLFEELEILKNTLWVDNEVCIKIKELESINMNTLFQLEYK